MLQSIPQVIAPKKQQSAPLRPFQQPRQFFGKFIQRPASDELAVTGIGLFELAVSDLNPPRKVKALNSRFEKSGLFYLGLDEDGPQVIANQ